MMPRTESTSEFQPLEDKEVEYFFASDASAVIEHTNRVIYLEVSRDSGWMLFNKSNYYYHLSGVRIRYTNANRSNFFFLNPIHTHPN